MIVTNAKNTWGSSGSPDVLQRTDLWQVDFSRISVALAGTTVGPNHVRSVTLPPKSMKASLVRRGSRSYNMPDFDDALEASKVVFFFSTVSEARSSPVYRFLDAWWNLVRAGRGAIPSHGHALKTLSDSITSDPITSSRIDPNRYYGDNDSIRAMSAQTENGIYKSLKATSSFLGNPLDRNYSVQFCSDIQITLFAGVGLKSPKEAALVATSAFTLVNAWVSAFKLSDLTYEQGNGLVTLEATFYAESLEETSL